MHAMLSNVSHHLNFQALQQTASTITINYVYNNTILLVTYFRRLHSLCAPLHLGARYLVHGHSFAI
jgi:hypothetical protein